MKETEFHRNFSAHRKKVEFHWNLNEEKKAKKKSLVEKQEEETNPKMSDSDEEKFDSASVRPKFIPRGYEKLNPHIYRNIFYSTSTADSFRSPMEHSSSAPVLLEQARAKSVQGIHDINRSGKFKPSRAPLYQRSMCSYTQQFVPRPLDGVQINKECYNLFKEKCETPATSSGGKGAKFHDETTTGASYPNYSSEASQKAIPPNFKPKNQVHVSRENKLLVTLSAQHREFPCPTPEATRTARPEAFKPKYKTHRSVGTMSAVSSYNRDYHPDKYNSVWPVRFARQDKPPPPTSGYTGKMRLDPEGDKKLVPEDFRIGDVVSYGPC